MKCVRCKEIIPDNACTGESGIYMSQDYHVLCEPCFWDEDTEIEAKGTNDLPDTLNIYNSRHGTIKFNL